MPSLAFTARILVSTYLTSLAAYRSAARDAEDAVWPLHRQLEISVGWKK